MTAKKKTVYEALSQVQANLNAPKGQMNKFGGYYYRSCEDILQAVKPLLGDAVILVSDEVKLIGDRYYIEANAKFILNGDVIENKAYAREPVVKKGMDEAQITGATSSYARKYALNGLLLIDDNKDADTKSKEDNCSVSNMSGLLQVMGDGDDVATCNYWRSLDQDTQQLEWRKIDKETQKHLKKLLQEHPPKEQAA